MQCPDFPDQRHYVVLLCMKCDGTLDRKLTKNNRDRIISRGLGLDVSAAEEVKKKLIEMKLIDKKWFPIGWSKRQYESDGSTQRTRKYRKTKEVGNVTGTSRERHKPVTVTPPEADTETDTETDKKKGETSPKVLGLNLDAWSEVVAHRKLLGLKKYKSDRMAKKLATLPHDLQMKCVQYSLDNEYAGIFPDRFKNENDKRNNSSSGAGFSEDFDSTDPLDNL
jgi:hypothetical protein